MPDQITIKQLRDAVNSACTCGGAGPGEGCPACEVWHELVTKNDINQGEKDNVEMG